MPLKRTNLQERYELKEVLGRGGMGVVYRAVDTLMNREVALKTILDIDNPATIQLFYKEWTVLSSMVHPNVVNIYDIGEFDENGSKKPFFVMPLLPGVTLDKLIKEGSPRLSVHGVLEIIDQACRGLHAAHEQGLVHRDVKPSNIFVMDDNSVKIIDFGIARDATANSRTTIKGTLYYLSPEQLEMQTPSPLSDLFALAVVTYETLTRQRPFRGGNEHEVVEAIRRFVPPPVSELNHDVPYSVSQVIHKAMAKQPWHRFFNAREFADALQKASRNEPLDYFDSSKIKPRLQRAARSFEEGDYAFAAEVISELEAEGHLDQEIGLLRARVDQAVRQTRTKQMLESARRFFEASEYPLALRKVQEALDLDPEDNDALALKGRIERERRERKISEWIALAQQHLQNNSFRQAREALDNVVTLKPNDTDALGMLAEVGRRETEFSRVRDEKSKLYQSAMHAWEKGEVTAAMSRLEVLMAMDRDLPDADPGRSGGYQNFYNQVHSEHNGIKNAYEEARRNLSADNFEAALAACKQYLAKYPNHALFQALKFDVEERQRQKLSGVIAETDRRVEAEPDLDRKMGILEEVLKTYPGEAHFESAMRLVRDKRDLVNSIVGKAHLFEERNQFNEALDQWQILKSIHERQPGLAFEIQRLMKRRDQQAHESSKARWVEQADKYLEDGDYDRSLQTVQNGLAEFPNEAELLELEKMVRKHQERAGQAMDLLRRARELSEKGAPDDALAALREASQLDPRNTVIRTVLINSLLDRARRLVDTEPDAAEAGVKEILELEPSHAGAQSLAARLGDKKRDDFIAWCLSQARRMQTEGDFDGAAAVVNQGLAVYPNEPRLRQLEATLQRAKADAAKRTATQIPAVAPPAATQTPAPRAPEAAPPLPPPVAPPPPPAAAKPAPPPAAKPLPPPPKAKAPAKPMSAGTKKGLVLGGIAAALLAAVGGTFLFLHNRKSETPAPAVAPTSTAKLSFGVAASPLGADIAIDGNVCGKSTCLIEIGPGAHTVVAKLAGYQDASATFNVEPAQKTVPPLSLTLQQAGSRISIVTDLPAGAIKVDGNASGNIQDGAGEVLALSSGKHKVQIDAPGAAASFDVDLTDGQPPAISGLQATSLRGFVLARSGNDAKLYGSLPGYTATLDGKSLGAVTAGGSNLAGLSPGPHELSIEGPAKQHDEIAFEAQPASALYVSLRTDHLVGMLRINVNQDQAEVYLNGEKYKRPVMKGKLLIYLPVKSYMVRVQADGFAPSEQTVDLKRGEEKALTFNLAPARSTLAIHHAPPGAEVLIDGKTVGTVLANGELSLDAEVGRHSIIVRHPQYKNLQADRILTSGKATDLDATLEPLTGTVRIDVTPADARLRLRPENGPERDITGTSVNLPEGSYTLTASAPRFQDASTTVRVSVNKTVNATLNLRPVETKSPPKTSTPAAATLVTLDEIRNTPGWSSEPSGLVKRGGDLSLVAVDFTQANIRFKVQSLKGKRLEWVVGYESPKNYYLMQMDDKNFYRTAVVEGKRSDQVKVAHGLDRKQAIGINIAITPSSIVHSLLKGSEWVIIDRWEFPAGLVKGKFGFEVPGKDEIAISEFQLTRQ